MAPLNEPARTDREARDKVFELIKDAKFAMLASLGSDSHWHARPMATAKEPLEGDLWFFTDARSEKVTDLQIDSEVLLTYANESDNAYVSLSGTAEVLHDREKVKQLWSEWVRPWFPGGEDDPNIALIRVTPENAEYWDAPSSKMVTLFGYAKAMVTGERPKNVGENEKVDFV